MPKTTTQTLALVASVTGAQFDALAAHYAALRAVGVSHRKAIQTVTDTAWQAIA